MNGTERREQILSILKNSEKPSCSIIEPDMQKQEVKVCEWFAEKRADCSSDTGE